MEDQVDIADISWIRFIFASITVLGLISIMALIFKSPPFQKWFSLKRKTEKRLEVVESLPLDAKRRLVIIKCDGKEQLLLLGEQDIVIKDLPSASAKRIAKNRKQ